MKNFLTLCLFAEQTFNGAVKLKTFVFLQSLVRIGIKLFKILIPKHGFRDKVGLRVKK